MTQLEATALANAMFAQWDLLDFEHRCINAKQFCDSFAEIQDLLSASQYLKVQSFYDDAMEYYLPKLWA